MVLCVSIAIAAAAARHNTLLASSMWSEGAFEFGDITASPVCNVYAQPPWIAAPVCAASNTNVFDKQMLTKARNFAGTFARCLLDSAWSHMVVGSEWACEYGNIDKWSICDVDVQSPTIAAPGSVASHVNVLRERACTTIRYAHAHFTTSTALGRNFLQRRTPLARVWACGMLSLWTFPYRNSCLMHFAWECSTPKFSSFR